MDLALSFLCPLHTNCYFYFKWRRTFHLLKALSTSWNTFWSRYSRSIFWIHFCNFLINYMIQTIYFLPNISKSRNNRGLYLSKQFYTSTLLSYILVKKWNFGFSIYLKPKHKIYILSKKVLLRICRPHLGK